MVLLVAGTDRSRGAARWLLVLAAGSAVLAAALLLTLRGRGRGYTPPPPDDLPQFEARGLPALTFEGTVFPTGDDWPTASAAEAGWDAAALAEAVELARTANSCAFLLLYQGRIVAEHYWPVDHDALAEELQLAPRSLILEPLADGRPRVESTSVQKSVLGLLVARARDRGALGFDDPLEKHIGPGWSEAPRDREAAVTVRHVLTMTAGLSESRRYEVPAGDRWRYSAQTPQLVFRCLQNATGVDVDTLLRRWLLGPLAIEDSGWSTWDRKKGLRGFATTARDLARIGLLVQAGGRWGERRIVPEKTLSEMLQPSQEHNPIYGCFWWLNRPGGLQLGGDRMPTAPMPSAPDDMVMAMGLYDNLLCVSRKERIVMVRLGVRTAKPPEDQALRIPNRIWERIVAARPARG